MLHLPASSTTTHSTGEPVKNRGGQTVSYLYDGLDAVQETQGRTVNPIRTGFAPMSTMCVVKRMDVPASSATRFALGNL
ncbi:MAG: hypothetical protein ABW002_14390 [Xanthomonas sp.]